MKTITRADWGLQLEAFARTIAPLIATAMLARLVIQEGKALDAALAALGAMLRWIDRLLFPAPVPAPPAAPAAPIRIPAAELLAAGGLEAAEIEAILIAPAAAPRKRSKRSTRRRAAAC